MIKAVAASRIFPGIVLADDSGIEADALGGSPGVYSARYTGESATDGENNAKLLRELEAAGARGRERSGRFRCVMALAKNGEPIATFDGAVEGTIINQEKGGGGFGYDPLFVPEGHCETFGELAAEVKNGMSHRGRALVKVKEYLLAERKERAER